METVQDLIRSEYLALFFLCSKNKIIAGLQHSPANVDRELLYHLLQYD
jgi:hypothetical protein